MSFFSAEDMRRESAFYGDLTIEWLAKGDIKVAIGAAKTAWRAACQAAKLEGWLHANELGICNHSGVLHAHGQDCQEWKVSA